ncbi:uncharacterized protein BX664DRAFT_381871 [Halteromyces radiatus]|uniref:uncharacterized protein n=1 Tax=Halteromyces radiatus TaxID=101107 RepID=UPI00221FC95A|nr:uncharacterized protein BX664DRAFT_381871 [Halteromyces radiatus]KAI8099294.1 hypothetical protein BX664DRAFT_381871 [Halteromyces radiatus]
MDNDLYKQAFERIKEYELSTEEIQAIETAKKQLNRHAIIGGLGLSLASFVFGKRRQLNPLPLGLMTGAGMLIGSQIGFASGAMAGVRTIKRLPNPERLVNLVKDVQTDMLASRGLIVDGPNRPPRPMTEEEKLQYQQKVKDRRENYQRHKQLNDDTTSSWDRLRNSTQQTDMWNDTKDGATMTENEWMDQNGAYPSSTSKPAKNKYGDDLS